MKFDAIPVELRERAEAGPGMEPDPGDDFSWPSVRPATVADHELTDADVPAPDASWERIGWFASWLDGNALFGGRENLGAFANTVDLFYSRVRELPPLDLRSLRACLFFEQRRHHHLAHYPDIAKTAYMRTLIEAIRDHVRRHRGTSSRSVGAPNA